jgi:dephospho-CoA kinase
MGSFGTRLKAKSGNRIRQRFVEGCFLEVRLDSMKIIILTGGIGSGKSTVGTILKVLGAAVIDSDRLGREALDPGTPGFKETVETFGQDILTVHGVIDRPKLGRIVFNNPEALMKLNRIVHPRVDAVIEERLQEYRKQGFRAVFIEMAILAKAPYMEKVDAVWVVRAPRETILERLQGRGVDPKDALARMANQPPVEERIKDNLTIITNDGDKAGLKQKIKKLWEGL